ncbi:MAG: DUF6728 family protein [Cytophagales bacterium]
MNKFSGFKELFSYFFSKRNSPNYSVKAMHWVNRLSMVMFLIALVVIVYRLFIR